MQLNKTVLYRNCKIGSRFKRTEFLKSFPIQIRASKNQYSASVKELAVQSEFQTDDIWRNLYFKYCPGYLSVTPFKKTDGEVIGLFSGLFLRFTQFDGLEDLSEINRTYSIYKS